MKILKLNEFFYEDSFLGLLKSMPEDPISKSLLSLVNNYGSSKQEYTPLSPIEKIEIDINNLEQLVFTLSEKPKEQSMRIGRLVRKILSDCNISFTNKDIEIFSNNLKSSNSHLFFKVVSGKDIKEYYKRSKYNTTNGEPSSSLYCSCMTDKLDYLDLYSKNKNCKLLVLVDDKDTLYGRALLWNGISNEKDIQFVDTIYVSNYYLESKFIEYTKKNNLYRSFRDDDNKRYIKDVSGNIVKDFYVEVENNEFDKYPYVDTVYYLSGNKLSSIDNAKKSELIKVLRNTDGSYRNEYNPSDDNIYFEKISYNDIDKYLDPNNQSPLVSSSDLFLDYDFDIVYFYKREQIDFLFLFDIEKNVLGYAPLLNAVVNNTKYLLVDSYCAEGDPLSEKFIKYLTDNKMPYINDDLKLMIGETMSDIDDITIDLKHTLTDEDCSKLYASILDYDIYNKSKNQLLRYYDKKFLKDGDISYYLYNMNSVGYLVYKTPKSEPIMVYDKENIIFCKLDNKYYYKDDVVLVYISSSDRDYVYKSYAIEVKDSHRGTKLVYEWSRYFYPNLEVEDNRRILYYLIRYNLPSEFKSSSPPNYSDSIWVNNKLTIDLGSSPERKLVISQKNLNYIFEVSFAGVITVYKLKSIREYLGMINEIFSKARKLSKH